MNDKEAEAGREGGRQAGRQAGREAGREGGREGGRQAGREGGREGGRYQGARGIMGQGGRLVCGGKAQNTANTPTVACEAQAIQCETPHRAWKRLAGSAKH